MQQGGFLLGEQPMSAKNHCWLTMYASGLQIRYKRLKKTFFLSPASLTCVQITLFSVIFFLFKEKCFKMIIICRLIAQESTCHHVSVPRTARCVLQVCQDKSQTLKNSIPSLRYFHTPLRGALNGRVTCFWHACNNKLLLIQIKLYE